MLEGKTRVITVIWKPELGLEPLVLKTTGKAGYHIHGDADFGIIGYRIYADSITHLIPAANVLRVETDL